MAEAKEDWSSATVIDSSELGEYLIEGFQDEKDNILVKAYSVVVKPSGIDEDGLARYLADRFMYFVFSAKQIEKLRSEEKSPHRRAVKRAMIKENYIKDGTLGEFFLFLMTDGFLNVPMVSHKIAYKQSFEHEVYGADGIFFGSYRGEEKIGIGEAKIQKSFSGALEEAIESIYRFHGADSSTAWEQELNVAPKNLSDNLVTEERIDKVANILTEENYANYPLFHPVFISYESKRLQNLDFSSSNISDIENQIISHMSGMDYISKCEEKIHRTNASEVNVAELVFFHLPVGDLDRLREKILLEISPSLRFVMDDVIDQMNQPNQPVEITRGGPD